MTNKSLIIAARKSFLKKETKRKEEAERKRLQVLNESTLLLRPYFQQIEGCEVHLFGSVTREGQFGRSSDVDIAVKGYTGNRLDLFGHLSEILPYPFDLVFLEGCHFAQKIQQHGIRIC